MVEHGELLPLERYSLYNWIKAYIEQSDKWKEIELLKANKKIQYYLMINTILLDYAYINIW